MDSVEKKYSEMSDSALEEIGGAIGETSVDSQDDLSTIPSELLQGLSQTEPVQGESKFEELDSDGQLDVLAKANAKVHGFVPNE